MINRFLKAKHWHLFVLLFGIPFIFQVLMMISMTSNFSSEDSKAHNMTLDYMKFFPIVFTIFMAIFCGWFWSVASGLQKIIPPEIKLKVGRFKVLLIFSFIEMILFSAVFMNSFSFGSKISFGMIFPFHAFASLCLLYCLYFVAKTIKTAELQRKVTFNDYAGEFFLIWFFPIGIWIIQPKINKMIEELAHTANRRYV